MNPVLRSARAVTDISEHVKLNQNGINRAAQQVRLDFLHFISKQLISLADSFRPAVDPLTDRKGTLHTIELGNGTASPRSFPSHSRIYRKLGFPRFLPQLLFLVFVTFGSKIWSQVQVSV